MHTLTEHKFTLYFQPVLPYTGIYDEEQFAADGALTLGTTMNTVPASVAVSILTSNPTVLLETVAVPYIIQIDSEQLTVTSCTSAIPQVATVSRAANGTTIAAHSIGATVEIAESTASLVPATTLYPATSLYPISDLGSSYYAF
jgi:hypothetical protein